MTRSCHVADPQLLAFAGVEPQLDDVAIGNKVIGTDLLPVKLPAAPYAGKLELFCQVFVYQTGHVAHGITMVDGKRPVNVRFFARGLGVNAHDL